MGNSTVYLKVEGGQVRFLAKGTGAPNTWSVIDPSGYTAQDGSNLMLFSDATTGASPTPATITVGNVAGPELSSTGNPGIAATTALRGEISESGETYTCGSV